MSVQEPTMAQPQPAASAKAAKTSDAPFTWEDPFLMDEQLS